MAMLDRYKKKGETGLMELVRLVEDSSEPKKTQLINMIRNEEMAYWSQVEARVLTFDAIRKIPENMLAEIIAATPAKYITLALVDESADFVKLVEKCLGKKFSEYKSEKENLAATPATPGQVESGKRKIMAEARKLEAAGQIKLPIAALNQVAPTATAGAASATVTAATPETAAAPSFAPATAEDGCPSIETFGLEPPVAGLSGERLEAFFKSRLR